MLATTSSAAQDYLKALYFLAAESGDERAAVSTTAIAQHIGVSAASATNMLKKLGTMGLVGHAPYRGAELTDSGLKVALEVIRHHRLLETYLAEALGVPWDEVHEEAEILEHVISENLEDRMAERLGNPVADPHGHPIPSKEGSMPPTSARRLWEVGDGQVATVERVSDYQAEALRYLASIGVRPGEKVQVLRRGPVGGPLFVQIESGVRSGEEALSKELAEAIWVS